MYSCRIREFCTKKFRLYFVNENGLVEGVIEFRNGFVLFIFINNISIYIPIKWIFDGGEYAHHQTMYGMCLTSFGDHTISLLFTCFFAFSNINF